MTDNIIEKYLKESVENEVIDDLAKGYKKSMTGPGGKKYEGDIFYSDIYSKLKGKYGKKPVPPAAHQKVVDELRRKGFYIHS